MSFFFPLLSPLYLEQWPTQPLKLLFQRVFFFLGMLACARYHRQRGNGNRGLKQKRLSSYPPGREHHAGHPKTSCRRCSRAGWSFGRFALWIGPLRPTGRCGWCLWDQRLFHWGHQQNANAEKLAGRVCWGQSQEITSAPGAARQKLSRRVRQPQQRCIASWDRQSLGNSPHPAPNGGAFPASSPTARVRVSGEGGSLWWGGVAAARPWRRQVLKSDCKGHRVASWICHRNKAGKGHAHSGRRPWTLVQIYPGIWKSKHGGAQRELRWLELPPNSSFWLELVTNFATKRFSSDIACSDQAREFFTRMYAYWTNLFPFSFFFFFSLF